MPPESLTRIEISKEYLNFSAGHFTIFSAAERENLHGHNFQVRCAVTIPVGADGLAFNYAVLKGVLHELCEALDERVLLPERSPYLSLERHDAMVIACFGDERIPFLARDCLPLPIRNSTIEELAHLLLARLKSRPEVADWAIRSMEIGVSSGAGQWAYSHWDAT